MLFCQKKPQKAKKQTQKKQLKNDFISSLEKNDKIEFHDW